jgi:hypothetical protein
MLDFARAEDIYTHIWFGLIANSVDDLLTTILFLIIGHTLTFREAVGTSVRIWAQFRATAWSVASFST